jgi:hypothetical protein
MTLALQFAAYFAFAGVVITGDAIMLHVLTGIF